jgi:S-adenosylhomocysteine hydrolase
MGVPVLPKASYCALAMSHQVAFRGTYDDARAAYERILTACAGDCWITDNADCHADGGLFAGSVELVGPAGVRATVSVSPAPNFHYSQAPEYQLGVVVTHGKDDEAEQSRRALFSLLDQTPLTGFELAELRRQFPLTQEYARSAGTHALKDRAVLLAIHHMNDFVAMMDALVAMGVQPQHVTILDKGYPYTQRHRVDGWLREVLGLTVFTYPERVAAVLHHIKMAESQGLKSLILDDGGHVLPIVMREFPDHADHFLGVVEQTVSGIWKLAAVELRVPVFSVAESQLKAAVESYGVAAAGVASMLSLLPHEKIEGQAALVVGYGRIGRQVANVLRSRKMRVSVYDREMVQLVTAHEEGFVTSRSLHELIETQQPLLVMGTAGRDSINASHLKSFTKSAYLGSITSRTYEYNQAELAAGSRAVIDHGRLGHSYLLDDDVELCLLGHGMPLNFYHAESLPNRYIDLIVASLLLGAVTLAQPDQGGFVAGHNVELTNRVLNSSSALDTYYDWYGERTARRELLSPRSSAGDRRYSMPPWTFETHTTADGAA